MNGYGAVQPNRQLVHVVFLTYSFFISFSLSLKGSGRAQLSTVAALDRESVSSYHMIATVSDNGPSPLSDTADVFVTVLDVNDHAPVFDVSGYTVEIAEENTYHSCLTVSVCVCLCALYIVILHRLRIRWMKKVLILKCHTVL